MKTNNIIRDKSYEFALKVTMLCQHIQRDKKEYSLTRQLVNSGTSVGSNIEEAIGGQSRKDFFAKLTISYKEARESRYWLRLLRDTGIAEKEKTNLLISDCEEIIRIITAIQKTMRKNDSPPICN